MHLLCKSLCHHPCHCRSCSCRAVFTLFIWICLSGLTLVAADPHGAAGSHLFSQWQLQASSLRAVYSPISTTTNALLLEGWPRHYWRSLASVGHHEEEKDYLGDYSPSSNVDGGFVAPPPSIVVGNKRKLLQDYVPTANTSPGSSDGQP